MEKKAIDILGQTATIMAQEVVEQGRQPKRVKVAALDTGLNRQHYALPKGFCDRATFRDFRPLSDSDYCFDEDGHGTDVGIIPARVTDAVDVFFGKISTDRLHMLDHPTISIVETVT